MPVTDRTYELPMLDQVQCPLFSILPGEIRNLVFQYALSEHEDLTKQHSEDTYFYRPGQRARTRTDTALLLTCQRIHNESWFIPWLMREPTTYLAEASRRPGSYTRPEQVQRMLTKINNSYGEGVARIPNMRIYAQLCSLEDGRTLRWICEFWYFYPTCITISIRHTDWWYWEYDEPLKIAAEWISMCKFPNSLKEVRMELETTHRRISQVQEVAKLMKASWSFTREDGCKLVPSANEADKVHYWEGSSILDKERWIRDEIRPGKLQYYVQTVRFSLQREQTSHTLPVPEDIKLADRGFTRMTFDTPYVGVREILRRGLAKDAPVDDVVDARDRYRQTCWCFENANRPGHAESCCSKLAERGVGVGWRDTHQVPSSDLCVHCQIENCEVSTRRARRRRVRQWFQEAQQAQEAQEAQEPASIDGYGEEEFWIRLFTEE